MPDKHRALIIEDDDRNAADLAEIIGAMDCGVAIARSKEEALTLLERERPCVILLDLQIPRTKRSLTGESAVGISLLEEIRRASGGRLRRQTWIPVIVVSGHAGIADDAVELMKLGADDVIQKPYDADDVTQKVEEALKTSGRGSHANCANILHADTESCVIDIPATRQKDRALVRIAGQEVRLTLGALSVLLRLLIGRALDKPVPLSAFGSDRKPIDRLRRDLDHILSDPTAFVVVSQSSYSLPEAVSIGRVETQRLIGLGHQTITDLSRELEIAREKTCRDPEYATTCWALMSVSRPIGVHDSAGRTR